MLICGLFAKEFSIALSNDKLYIDPGDNVPLAFNVLYGDTELALYPGVLPNVFCKKK